jgi:WD40-like Beta Propeller Repeat/S-layer homology domain
VRKPLALIGLAALVSGSLAGPLATSAVEPAAFPGSNGRILFVSTEPGKPVIASMTDTGADIKLLTQAGQSPTDFGDQNPRWSPGGKFIVFTRYYTGGNGDIWTMNADGTGQKRLTNTATDDDWPGFSADGSRIVFSSNRSGNHEIYSMALNGSGLLRLTTNAAMDWLPSWSPNNNRIAFTSDRRGTNEIYTMNSNGTGVTRETAATASHDIDPVWSSDGSTIYYVSWTQDFIDSEIRRVNLGSDVDESVVEMIPGLPQFDPALPPDPSGTDQILAFVRAGEELDILFTNGDAFSTITNGYPYDVFTPDWQAIPAFPLVDARFSPFKLDIEWVFAEGITSGCSPERYCPNDPVTREQMASFLSRALGLTGTPPDAFVDDESSTHELNINRIAAAGITSGCNPAAHLYCPTANVRRDEMASFLSRALGLTGTPPDAFTDDNGNTHELNINRVAAAGITTGCGGTNYCPSQDVTRGQMAAFLHRAFD